MEAYGSRTTGGAHKSDYAILYSCGYGFKLETTGAVMNMVGIKGERVSSKSDLYGVLEQKVGMALNTAGAILMKAGLIRIG